MARTRQVNRWAGAVARAPWWLGLLLAAAGHAGAAVTPGTTIETMDGTIGTWDKIDWVSTNHFTVITTTNHIIGVPDSIRFLGDGQLNVNEVYIGGVFHLQMDNVPTDNYLRLDASIHQGNYGGNLEHWGMGVVLFFDEDNWVTMTRIRAAGGGYMSIRRIAGAESTHHMAVGFGADNQWRMQGIDLTSSNINFYATPLTGPETFSSNNWDQLMSLDLGANSFPRPPSYTGNVSLIVGKGYAGGPGSDPWNGAWDLVEPKIVGIDATRIILGSAPIEDFAVTDFAVEETLGLAFNALPGTTYRLQATPDLVSSNFSDTGAFVVGDGGQMMLFDPAGPSTSRNYRVVESGLQSGEPGFGKQWIRNHPFGIQAISWVPATFDHAEYFAAGMTHLFLHPSNGVPVPAPPPYDTVFWHAEILANQQGIDQFEVLKFIPANTGWVIGDEPPEAALPNLATYYDYVRQNEVSNTKICYTANGPADSQSHLEATADILNPDMMYYDLYPWSVFGGIQDSLAQLMRVRNVALVRNMPYGAWLQGFEGDGMAPSRNRVNVFSHLTAGYTHLSYWTYDYREDTGAGLIDQAGNPTPLYNAAVGSNAEAARLGQALRFLESTDVRFIGTGLGGENTPPVGMSNWAPGAGGDTLITAVQIDAGQNPPGATYKNGLIGFFTDDGGDRYFFLTNLAHGSAASADTESLSFTMTFSASVTDLWRLSRVTGLPEVVPLSGNQRQVTLPGGTGDLFRYNTGDFPGLP